MLTTSVGNAGEEKFGNVEWLVILDLWTDHEYGEELGEHDSLHSFIVKKVVDFHCTSVKKIMLYI